MESLRDRVERVALTDFTVLVEGESGTGKELVARQVHELSRRRAGPFVAVNCAAVVETLLEAELFGIEERTATGVRGRRGKFEHANAGTLFLDEVSDLALSAQAKLLRAIQDLAVERVGGTGARRVDTRIVAATNRPLSELVARGLFRADLYYRLSGVDIHVPPLRLRRDDIPELAAYFLARHRATRDLSISDAALDALRLYDWPGNVRELERLIERAIALVASTRIELSDLPSQICGRYGEVLGPSIAAGDSMRAWGSRYARLMFERCGRNKRAAARALDISYHTLAAYLYYGCSNRTSGKRVPAWARPEDDPGQARPSGRDALARPAAEGGLPCIFERQVEQLLSIRVVRLREIPARYQGEGIIVDLSETGARLQLPVAPPRDRPCSVQIEWRNTIVTLQARVVRSVQRSVQSESATLARTEYYVAIEFLDPTREAIDAVRRILQND